jgi:hypothetical protein
VLHAPPSPSQVIFQHYARDLEGVQAQYEAHKHAPPLPHNVPPTAGSIMWSRHLLTRIEGPMQTFAPNKALMGLKESKKVIRLYNRVSARVLATVRTVPSPCSPPASRSRTQVARALVEFETLHHQAWLKAIEAQRAGLHAPLLVRQPDNGRLLVNLSKDLMQLIRCGALGLRARAPVYVAWLTPWLPERGGVHEHAHVDTLVLLLPPLPRVPAGRPSTCGAWACTCPRLRPRCCCRRRSSSFTSRSSPARWGRMRTRVRG